MYLISVAQSLKLIDQYNKYCDDCCMHSGFGLRFVAAIAGADSTPLLLDGSYDSYKSSHKWHRRIWQCHYWHCCVGCVDGLVPNSSSEANKASQLQAGKAGQLQTELVMAPCVNIDTWFKSSVIFNNLLMF